jgi:hypothetical protein
LRWYSSLVVSTKVGKTLIYLTGFLRSALLLSSPAEV